MTIVNAIEVTGLVRRYGEYTAVDHFDLAVATGECVAMLGPNGAGKTTTVEILEGYRHRDDGRVSVLGEDPAHADRAWRQRIGIVLQSTDDLLDVTVTEALEHFARFYEHPRAVADVIALVGLTEKADQRAGHLSGGQRRRLDVALGVVGNPEVLFLDEPTTGFDPEARRVFWQLIERLKGEGVTILLTTHYLEEADALADRVVVITRGKKVADTTPADLGSRNEGRIVVRWREGETLREEVTATPAALVATLSARFGGEIPGLEVLRPTLEEAYLELVDAAS
ncbi:MAG: ABC transporter ATP-binding protein [Acidimicrobiales bacterium]